MTVGGQADEEMAFEQSLMQDERKFVNAWSNTVTHILWHQEDEATLLAFKMDRPSCELKILTLTYTRRRDHGLLQALVKPIITKV